MTTFEDLGSPPGSAVQEARVSAVANDNATTRDVTGRIVVMDSYSASSMVTVKSSLWSVITDRSPG